MKTKLLTVFALVLCMSAFLLPVSAYAAAETEPGRLGEQFGDSRTTSPPTVEAWLSEDILFIEAADSGTGVEAVFVNEERINYRVDGGLALFASDYGDEGDSISIYAVDFAGNKSETVTVEIPQTTADPEPAEQATQSNPFTPDGQATVVDEATDSDGKSFYTFSTPAGNVFYLIIDHQSSSDNVYFLNAVTEDDLLALAESSDNSGSSAVPTPDPVPTTDPEPTADPDLEPTEESGGGNGTMIFIVIAIIALGGAGYYIKILRPKQQASQMGDDDEDDYEDGDDDEYMEFEDEPEDDEDYPEDENIAPEAEGE